MPNNRNFSQVLYDTVGFGAKPSKDSNRTLGFARDGEAATRIDIAFAKCLLDVLNGNVVFEQCGGIEQDLKLFRSPPCIKTSATPVTFKRRGRMTQSAIVRSSRSCFASV